MIPVTHFLASDNTLLEITEPKAASLTRAWTERFTRPLSYKKDGDAVRGYHLAHLGGHDVVLIRAANPAAIENALVMLRRKWQMPLLVVSGGMNYTDQHPNDWIPDLTPRIFDPHAVTVWQDAHTPTDE